MSTNLLAFITKHKVPISKNTRLERIGSGRNGEVYNIGKGKILKFGSVKNVPDNKRPQSEKNKEKKNQVKNAKHEYNITKKVGEQLNFVPKIHGNFYGNKNGSLFIMNKVPGETLHEFSQDATPEQLERIRKTLLGYISKLEKIGVVHGDLNPNNIMIEVLPGGQLKVTLIDFGRGRYKNNKTFGEVPYPFPTKLGCKPGSENSRYCKLPYVLTSRISQPTAKSNRNFINAFFGKSGGVVPRSTRLKNAINIINFKKKALERASNIQYANVRNKHGEIIGKTIKRIGQKGRLYTLLENFEKENIRIPKLINELIKNRKPVFDNNKNVNTFIEMLQKIKKAPNVPLFTPTKSRTPNKQRALTDPKNIAEILKRFMKVPIPRVPSPKISPNFNRKSNNNKYRQLLGESHVR